MITADKIQTLMALDTTALTQAIRRAGYKHHTLCDTEFVGLTNGNQFAYKGHRANGDEQVICKVFVSMDPSGHIVADY